MRKRAQFAGIVFAAVMCGHCAGLDHAAGGVADSVAAPNPVSGKRTLALDTDEQEIAKATSRMNDIIAKCRQSGVAVDQDTVLLAKLQPMLARIAPVTHRPNLPWEVHVLGVKDVNAFAIGGGKMFFYSGIRELVKTDDELAAVLAHEMSHNTCRHITEQESMSVADHLSTRMAQQSSSAYYSAVYTNQHEDEADRISLLYLALAGYDPGVVPGIWERANRQWGSNPGNFTFNHSLNADRARKTAALVPVAQQCFAGEGVVNPDYERLRVESPLVDRQEATSGFLALLEVVANTVVSHEETLAEARQREAAARAAGQVPAATSSQPAAARAPAVEPDLAAAIQLHQQRRLADAAAAYEKVLAKNPKNVIALYNLACICAVQANAQRALNLLGRAIDAGYKDAAHLQADPDFASIRATPKFQDLVRRAAAR